MVTVPCFLVDAFASRAFRGNPAAVCLLDKARPARWMQSVAAEMNVSETAFVVPGARGFGLRWFTPQCEVELCGHATLASAHVLWHEGIAPASQVLRFQTRSGELTADQRRRLIELDFPVRLPLTAKTPAGLARALGHQPIAAARCADDLLVELDSATSVQKLQPDIAAIAKLPFRGLIVTARSKAHGIDFVSRFFAPRVGVPEDPVTGSAHCALAPYWTQRLKRSTLRGHQLSSRGGRVEVELNGDRVLLRGQAVTVLRGELLA
jgi:PhzF family phenazine biosynthesis protein